MDVRAGLLRKLLLLLSLQSFPTLCNPIESSLPGSSVPGILQARTLELVAISFSNAWMWKWSRSVVSDSSPPHGLQPTMLLRPWDFPGKNTGVGYCFLLQQRKLSAEELMLLNCDMKTLENPLDSKEIQPVYPKRNQSWIFLGKTDAEAETPILWPPNRKNWLIWKDPDAGKDWRREVKGMTKDEMFAWHHWLDGHEFE